MPCALMLDLAAALDPLLNAREAARDAGLLDDEQEDVADTTLQLVFFDGEEAFKDWTATDSIYGARCETTNIRVYTIDQALTSFFT